MSRPRRRPRTYQGFAFDRTTVVIDLDKLAKLQANPAAAASLKSMFRDGKMTYWLGTDGKRVIQVIANTWDEAKAQLDVFMKGEGGIGTNASFKAVRGKLPEKANLMVLVSMQGLVKMFANQFAAVLNKPDLKPPGDMPKEAALFGLSLSPAAPNGYEFHLVVPSCVGPVIEKGMIPVFQSLQGQVVR